MRGTEGLMRRAANRHDHARIVAAHRSKYGNVKTTMDGVTFASKAEARRYRELVLLQRAGQIAQMTLQPRYALKVNGIIVGTYVADFGYMEKRDESPSAVVWQHVIEDVKSSATKTPVYRLKAKLMLAIYGVTIRETP